MTKRALIVDDEQDILNVLSRILKRLDFETETACNGQEALDKVNTSSFDLIVLDNTMPVMTGEEFLENIYAAKSKDYAIILTSGRALNMFDLINRGEYFTIVDYILNKPYKIDNIREIIKELKLND